MILPIITAAEARAMDPALEAPAVLAALDRLIRDAAHKGEKDIRVPDAMVKMSGYAIGFRTPGIGEALKELGFSVSPRSMERDFVEVWLEVSWREA